MAHTAVEAQSLSALTEIAARPPKYPRNPTEERRDPLVLYLARVPGSQDIILSPLKPDLKNLTAVDVASSLYYIHRNLPSDLALLNPEPTPRASIEPQIARKPLPESSPTLALEREKRDHAELHSLNQARAWFLEANKTPNVSTAELTHQTLAGSRTDAAGLSSQVRRRPVSPNAAISQPIEVEQPVARPLGPRPMGDGHSFVSVSTEPSRNYMGPPLTTTETAKSSVRSFKPTPTQPVKTHSLTIIRRDLGSGAQWNVGFIEVTKKLSNQAAGSSTENGSSDCTIHINLTTPGYHQFSANPMHGFNREVTTEYSNFWDHAFRRHQRGTSTTSSLGHSRGNSEGSNGSIDFTPGQQNSPSKSKARMRTYTMLSPWNGRCEFSTAGGGRSLRCRHTIASNSGGAQQGEERGDAVTVSELRYNLPSADLFKLPEPAKEAMKQSAAATIKSLKRTSQVVKTWQNKIRKDSNEDATRPSLPPRPSEEAKPTLPVRPPSTSYTAVYVSGDEDDFAEEDAELDLSLGREKAGGGNRGKRAKLGKLIIFDEGFKMLDLIVAANMGVWWAGWEV